jgi:hypothetical protein
MRTLFPITLILVLLFIMVKCRHCNADFVRIASHQPFCKEAPEGTAAALKKRPSDSLLSRPSKAARGFEANIEGAWRRDAVPVSPECPVVNACPVRNSARHPLTSQINKLPEPPPPSVSFFTQPRALPPGPTPLIELAPTQTGRRRRFPGRFHDFVLDKTPDFPDLLATQLPSDSTVPRSPVRTTMPLPRSEPLSSSLPLPLPPPSLHTITTATNKSGMFRTYPARPLQDPDDETSL